MTRKDIIIVAVLVNAALLAVLFMMAINSDEDKLNDPTEFTQISQIKPTEVALELTTPSQPIASATGDEGDNALKAFEGAEEQSYPNSNQTIDLDDEPVQDLEQDDDLPPQKEEEVKPAPSPATDSTSSTSPSTSSSSSSKFTEVKVKRGDSLDKIARANGTTIKAIKESNNLKNDLLNIGQVLKIPTASEKKTSSTTASAASATPAKKAVKTADKADKKVAKADDQFYTVKSGDSPWKIAKQFNMNLDDLLKLNKLDEQKARNLKAGDKIRIK